MQVRNIDCNSSSSKLSIENLNLNKKRILIRSDLNVPIVKSSIKDNRRIVGVLPTIKYALEQGASSVTLMSHLGRPKGKRNESLSLKEIARELSRLLDQEILFLSKTVGLHVTKICQNTNSGSISVLENLRFHPEEEGKGEDESGKQVKPSKELVMNFRTKLSKLGDVFINDAFGTSHRAHSSIVGIQIPERASGFLMKKELTYLGKALEKPKRPLIAIIGGAKIKDKILLIMNMLEKVNGIIVVGGMAFSFLKQDGMKIGNSLYDDYSPKIVPQIIAKAKENDVIIHFPVDFICGNKFSPDAEVKSCTKEEGIPEGWMGLDCGKKSSELFSSVILKSKTILWNGPPGVFEFEIFSSSTRLMLEAVKEATKKGAISVIGGGDTASAVKKFKGENEVSHISTGGGASLEFLEGKCLPGLNFLNDFSN